MEKAVDVAIVGCGPVGVTAANLLGMYGISTIVIEKEAKPHDLPRASSTDDEIMRIFQTVGLADQMLRDMSPAKGVRWVSESGEVLAELPFTETDVGLGYPAQIFFWQPDLEQILRAGVNRFDCVEVCLSNEVEALSQDAEGATLSVRDKQTGEAWSVKARYVLGCDGGRSTIRQLAGIHLTGSTSEHPWLVIDVAVKEPIPGLSYLHLDCDPNRPSVNYPMPLGHHRWEFMVMPGESSEELERPETVERLLSKYVDPREVQIVRRAVYRFHERVAESWHAGRVYLLGDAAHLMPPFLGQGMSSGIRDADNLCWKLAMVLKGMAAPRILDSYELERRPATEAMIEASVRNGQIIQTIRPSVAHLRDTVFKALNRIPRAREYVGHFDPKPAPVYKVGLLAGENHDNRHDAIGTLFIQPHVLRSSGERVLLDEVMGPGFAIVGMDLAPRVPLSARSRAFWASLPTRFVRVVSSHDRIGEVNGALPASEGVVDVDGKLTNWFEQHRVKAVVIRPDRHVLGVFDAGDIETAESQLRQLDLGG